MINRKETFLISIMLFFTIVGWIALDIYHIIKTQKVSLDPQYSQPVDASIDPTIFKILEQKR